MTLATHGDQKYQNSEKLAEAADWPALSIEHRRFEAGRQETPVPICTEIVMLLSGGGMVSRAGNGEVQKSVARPGMSYLVPVGTQETHLELSDRMECLHLYLRTSWGTIRLTAGVLPKSLRRSIREGSSACWTISRLLLVSTSGSKNWPPRLASAPIIFPGSFVKRLDCHRTAM
jgi:hypothetical protein